MSPSEGASSSSEAAPAGTLRCRKCLQVLASPNALVSKAFTGQHGRACLMEKVENVTLGEAETREMRTGLHSVSDIYCVTCGTNLGWKYHTAYNPSEKYKEGRFVLEVECIAKEDIPALMQQDTSNLEARHRLMRSGAA